jgi:hypothetical protein
VQLHALLENSFVKFDIVLRIAVEHVASNNVAEVVEGPNKIYFHMAVDTSDYLHSTMKNML